MEKGTIVIPIKYVASCDQTHSMHSYCIAP